MTKIAATPGEGCDVRYFQPPLFSSWITSFSLLPTGLLAMLVLAVMPAFSTGGPSVVGLPMGPGLRMGPYFVEEDLGQGIEAKTRSAENGKVVLFRNVSVHAGETAFLECTVRNLGAKKVYVLFYFSLPPLT